MFACAATLAVNLCIALTSANVEKIIFKTQKPAQSALSLDHLASQLTPLSPSQIALQSSIEVSFPQQETQDRGTESWLLLDGLEEDRRYEVRICWLATQPTSFTLQTWEPVEVLETEVLASSLKSYANSSERFTSPIPPKHDSYKLFLQILGRADYHSSSINLMWKPPPVDVEIILDPFILNILPHSLIPHLISIVSLVLLAWLTSGIIWRSTLRQAVPKSKRP